MTLSDVAVGVVVFVRTGCSHCEEYLPRVIRAAERWRACVPTYVLETTANARLADALHVEATPTTVLTRRGREAGRLDGAADDGAIDGLYRASGASCGGPPPPPAKGEAPATEG